MKRRTLLGVMVVFFLVSLTGMAGLSSSEWQPSKKIIEEFSDKWKTKTVELDEMYTVLEITYPDLSFLEGKSNRRFFEKHGDIFKAMEEKDFYRLYITIYSSNSKVFNLKFRLPKDPHYLLSVGDRGKGREFHITYFNLAWSEKSDQQEYKEFVEHAELLVKGGRIDQVEKGRRIKAFSNLIEKRKKMKAPIIINGYIDLVEDFEDLTMLYGVIKKGLPIALGIDPRGVLGRGPEDRSVKTTYIAIELE